MRTKPRFSALWALILLGCCTLLIAASVAAQEQPVFRIGVLDDPYGPASTGARLAVEALNQAGGVQGADGTFFRLDLVPQPTDGGLSLAAAVSNLAQASVIAVIGPISDDEVLNDLPTLQALNVPVLILGTGDTLLTADTTGRLLRMRAAEVLRGGALASYLVTDLGIQRIATVQYGFDLASAGGVIGFSKAASALGVAPQTAILIQTADEVDSAVSQVTQSNPEMVVAYGQPANVAAFYVALRASGWPGLFAYNEAEQPAFHESIPREQRAGIFSTSTWAFTTQDVPSQMFRDQYVVTFGAVPGALEAASYDAVSLLAEAIRRPGELLSNLQQLTAIRGVQGFLGVGSAGRSELSGNVAVIQFGPYGAPQVLARYDGSRRIPLELVTGPAATPLPAPTPTPQGVVATITRAVQNVRSGPGMVYDVIGQLNQGEQIQVIGANLDFTWLVIPFRGQQGWISRSILDTFGDLNTLPIVAAPPTPTPPPSPTAAPLPDIVIDAAAVSPNPILPGVPFNVSVTVRNAGAAPAGQFAIAATFPPNNVYTSAIIGGLGPGQSILTTLTGTLSNTGFYSVVIVADLNNDVQESNENNNLFNFSYTINKPIIGQGSQTLNPGNTIDLEGNALQGDANWNTGATSLDALFSAQLGIIPNVSLATIHWDLINSSIVNQTSIPAGSLVPGTVIGILTADGNRGAMRVDNLVGSQLTLTFLVYSN